MYSEKENMDESRSLDTAVKSANHASSNGITIDSHKNMSLLLSG
jgi:hypothetical protein